MNEFLRKHAGQITGTLSCFDRVLFRGYLPLESGWAMAGFLRQRGVRRTGLKNFRLEQAAYLKSKAFKLARATDGHTLDRAERVARFQSDAGCPLFLISLRAGGLGLNLTAAEYVFLLDPWWNPAVEAQAIDRTHRIGQIQSVFAYRLIARDTVEERVLELQRKKRDLADAIINQDNSLIRDLKREDLEQLLS